MTKFHVNDAGEPGPCRAGDGETAGVRGCPFGGPSDHHNTKEEARAAYEKKKEDEAVPEPSVKKPAEPEIDPEVMETSRILSEYGDASYLDDVGSAQRVAERLGLKYEHVQAVVALRKQEEEAEWEARRARGNARALEVARNTDPDVSKLRKGAVVAIKTDTNLYERVKITSHRKGRFWGNCTNGDYIDGWDDSSILTSESKLGDEVTPEAKSENPVEPKADPEVTEARKAMLGYGDDSFMEERNGAAIISKKLGIKEEVAQKVIDQLKQEEKVEQEARFAKTQVEARDIASKTNPDVSKVRKGATVAVKDGDALMTVKVSSHRGGKISGYASNGDYIDGWTDDVILTSDSKLD